MMRRFAIGILLFASWVSANADVLMWQVSPDARVADQVGHTVYSYLLQMMPIAENQTWAAQVYVKDADGNVLRTLENLTGTSTGNSWDRAIDANPLAAGQSITAESQAHNALGQGNYYQIHLKLGTEHGGSYIYEEVLYSANYSGRYLEAHHDYNFNWDDDDSALSPWSPLDFYSSNGVAPFIDYKGESAIEMLPEPSSGMLLLVGAGLLLLKRSRR